MRQHNWAFAAWEIEKSRGTIKNQSLLVHVDAHLDDTPDGVFVAGLKEAETVEEILRVAQGHDFARKEACPPDCMHIDNFIWAAVARGTIGETIFVSHQEEEVLSLDTLFEEAFLKGNENCMNILSQLPEGCNYKHQRYDDIPSFLSRVDMTTIDAYQTKILDIDLDYFNTSKECGSSQLQPLDEVHKSICSLKDLTHWDMITIAISPEFCGGNEEARQLLDAILQVFELNLGDAIRW